LSDLSELELEPQAAPAYIGAVVLNGVEQDLDRVLASVSIRHGRDDIDGPIQSSTATLRLRGLRRLELDSWTVGGELVVSDTDGDAIFTGRLSDASLTDDDPRVEARLEVIAASSLAAAGRRPVGGHAWPAEAWGDRMARILAEAELAGVVQAPSPDVPLAATIPSNPETGYFETVDALAALEADRQAVGATAFDRGDGSVVVQAFDARGGLYPPLELDPALVLYAPAWAQSLDVANRIVLGYGYGAGSVTVDDPVSQAQPWGVRWTGLFETGLADEQTARERALVWLNRITAPRWRLPGLTLLERHPLEVGLVLELLNLPPTAPLGSWTPIVEGWTDTVEGPDWTQDVILSDPIYSGLALPWQDLPPELLWSLVDPACAWADADVLDNLIPEGARRHAR
jgi:hypothetical protein